MQVVSKCETKFVSIEELWKNCNMHEMEKRNLNLKTYYDFGNDFGLAKRFEEKGKEATNKED